jgi:S1-C subfamily serine protease
MRISRIIAAAAIACASLPSHAQERPPPTARRRPPSRPTSKTRWSRCLPPCAGPTRSSHGRKAGPTEVTGSGVIIEGKRILTNAHVVGYASQVQVQANQAGDKVSATVVAIARGIDLAILKLDDESFFDKRPAVKRATQLPDVRDPVFAYGYPTGGNRCRSPRASSRASSSSTTARARPACASRSTPPSIPATAAGRPSPATR